MEITPTATINATSEPLSPTKIADELYPMLMETAEKHWREPTGEYEGMEDADNKALAQAIVELGLNPVMVQYVLDAAAKQHAPGFGWDMCCAMAYRIYLMRHLNADEKTAFLRGHAWSRFFYEATDSLRDCDNMPVMMRESMLDGRESELVK
jgi:hypothetical protein